MVKIAEVVLELSAEEFMNTGRRTRGRVVRNLDNQEFSIQVDDEVRKVKLPSGPFSTIEEARIELLGYWDRCDEEFVSAGGANWLPKF